MLFSANILVSILCSISFGLNPVSSFFAGLLVFFILNLIPHSTFWKKHKLISQIVITLDFIIGFSFLFLVTISLLEHSKEIIISMNSNSVILGISSFFAGLASTIVYCLFFYLENSEPKSKFLQQLLIYKRKIEYKDNSFWGVFIHIAIIILALAILFRLIDLPTWQKFISDISK